MAGMHTRWSIALVAALIACTGQAAVAATAAELTVEELARGSDAVVRVRAVRRECRWTGDGRRLLTDVEVRVTETWRGSPPALLLVTIPGGELDGVAQVVDGAPVLVEGDDVVLFLGRRGGEWRVAGLTFGAFRVTGEDATPDTSRLRLLPRAIVPGEALVRPMALAELRRRVESAR
jgi:hypothetical protein